MEDVVLPDSPFEGLSVPFVVIVLPLDTLDNEDTLEVSAELLICAFLFSDGERTCSSNIRGTLVTPKSLVFCVGPSIKDVQKIFRTLISSRPFSFGIVF